MTVMLMTAAQPSVIFLMIIKFSYTFLLNQAFVDIGFTASLLLLMYNNNDSCNRFPFNYVFSFLTSLKIYGKALKSFATNWACTLNEQKQNRELTTKHCYYTKRVNISCFICYYGLCENKYIDLVCVPLTVSNKTPITEIQIGVFIDIIDGRSDAA